MTKQSNNREDTWARNSYKHELDKLLIPDADEIEALLSDKRRKKQAYDKLITESIGWA
jgi:hypothetical protein